MGGVEGQATDIEIHTKEILRLREDLNQVLANCTGQPIDKIAADSDRNYFMSAEEAKSYGIIDEVISKSPVSAAKEKR